MVGDAVMGESQSCRPQTDVATSFGRHGAAAMKMDRAEWDRDWGGALFHVALIGALSMSLAHVVSVPEPPRNGGRVRGRMSD
jgi:hypothetical protein